MGNKQNYIEINGKKYDAQTGVQITDSTVAHHVAQAPVKSVSPSIDGFRRAPKKAMRPSYSSTVKNPDIKLQKSKTLMRAAVKKPSQLLKPQHAHTNQTTHISPHNTITPRHNVSPLREQHVQSIKKSDLVQKFGPSASSQAPHVSVPLAVHPEPAMSTSTIKHSVKSKTSDLLDKALEAAKGHNEPYFQHKQSIRSKVAKKLGISGRATAIGTAVVAGLLLGGFYAYQNVPNLAMRVAATRAGFNAGMPGYSPSGFGFSGPVQYSAGQVVVSFKSNTDDRNYHVTQQATNWSSDSLLNNYVVASGKQYQTYQDRGRTIYIYDGTSATWVNGGIWYQIDGKSDLTSDQLVRIAASL